MARKTAPVPLRSRKALPRKRATPAISWAKSVSLSSLNSTRLCSSITEESMTSMSSELSTAHSRSARSRRSARSSGGEPARKWRSDALLLTSVRSRFSMRSE